MLQVVYTSTASHEFSAADIERLLAGARARNKAIGVTGMLLFDDGTACRRSKASSAPSTRCSPASRAMPVIAILRCCIAVRALSNACSAIGRWALPTSAAPLISCAAS
jgi:Sensors of blue-light using FAD